MKMCKLGAELFHLDRQTEKRDEANSRFVQFCDRTEKRAEENSGGSSRNS
jgi:hypothetical protein